jgi:hypothetical protein
MDYAAWLHTGLARMVGQQFCSVFPYTAESLTNEMDVQIFKKYVHVCNPHSVKENFSFLESRLYN